MGYPVAGTCSRSSFCKWRTGACLFSVTPGMAVSMERIKTKGCTAFLSKVKDKSVNNSGSN